MKKTKILLSLVMFLLMTTFAWGVSSITGKWQGSRTALIYDATTTIDANSLQMFVYNNGNFAYDNANVGPAGKTDGLYYPRGTKKTAIFAAGLWIGAKVNNQVRIAMAEYSSEFVPGPMKNGTYQPDKAAFKVYKVGRGDNAASNPDYRDWPVDQGAPVDAEGKPAILGDQFLWSACNDADPAKHTNNSASTAPLGVEVQQSTFAYARGGALGNTIFMKFKFINKGSDTLYSTYVSLWADPDLGDAGDDLVGCDTALSLGYCYNSGADQIYGAAPPAVGFDFFKGPRDSTGNLADSAFFLGRWHTGWKELGMTAFSKYINGEDPQSASEVYLFMKGYRKFAGAMVPAVDPVTGEKTTFVLAGNPQTQTGWIDIQPGDRRFMMTSGPFNMAPGDSQEVVAAVLIGQGSDPLNSIGALKLVDRQAQAVFDLNFDIPNPPPNPNVWVRGGNGEVDITWDTKPVGDVQINDTLNQEFHFEGFNLYQGESEVGPWTKFATYDLSDANKVALIYNDVVDPAAGGIQRNIVQIGSNSGLTYHFTTSANQLDGSGLKNNQPYFFAVTAYSYDYRRVEPFYDQFGNLLGHMTETLESGIDPREVRPLDFAGTFVDTAGHTEGQSDGMVVVEYLDPAAVTGHTYKITFSDITTWNLLDLDLDTVLLANVPTRSVGTSDRKFPVVDGLMFRNIWRTDVKSVAEERNASGAVSPPVEVHLTENSTHEWYIDPGGNQAYTRYRWAGGNLHDYEIRFLADTTQYCWDYFGPFNDQDYSSVNPFKVPFELWDLGEHTLDNTSDDVKVSFIVLDNDKSGSYSWGDAIYFEAIPYNSIDWTLPGLTAETYDPDGDGLLWGRFNFQRANEQVTRPWPASGTVVRILTKWPNTTADVFAYKTKKVDEGDGSFVANSLDNIKTVPNPYYNFYQEEVDQFDRIIKFINLPAAPLKIRIFNIAGDLVRTMERTDIYKTEFVWDLKTDQGLWVASGVYVWLIDAQGLGTKYGKMAIFTEVEQLNIF